MAMYVPTAVAPPQPWKSPLFGCFDDIGSCLMALCCPCVLYGQIQERLDGTGCCSHCCIYACCLYWGCCCLIHGPRRRYLRQSYNIVEDCDDCLVTCFCDCCALAQESREIDARGPPVRQTMVTAIVAQPMQYGQPVYAQPVQYAQQPQQYAQQPQQYVPPEQQQPYQAAPPPQYQ